MAPDPDIAAHFPSVFPSCDVTRAQAQKWEETVNLADSFLRPAKYSLECTLFIKPPASSIDPENSNSEAVDLKFDEDHLIAAQRSDLSLVPCVEAAVPLEGLCSSRIAFIWEDGVLMRRWRPREVDDALAVYQIVLPSDYRPRLAHEHPLSGHLGVNKTYKRISRYFFWPGLKSSVSRFCKCCHVCQLAGKPNQTIPSAPLHLIPVVGEPFERLILDCVGPLPKSKSGHQYVLTLMCAATQFPEAMPLRTLKAQAIVKEIVKFCSTFGLPKVIQTDCGTNFTSKMFSQVLKDLGVDYQLSSAYHPESQGTLERFHQTLKTMLRAYCIDANRDWAEGLPLLTLAVRETVQESLGFSPAELVFGHTVRRPLKLLSEQLLSKHPVSSNILDYVSAFQECLHKACEVAKAHLVTAQSKMKLRYDKTSVKRIFQPGDLVLVLLPVPGSALQAKLAGHYTVDKRLSDTDYVISTPDRRRKSRMCHLNMLKAYVTKETSKACVDNVTPAFAATVLSAAYSPVEDNLVVHEDQMSCTRLNNSAVLNDLDAYLAHLPNDQRTDIIELMSRYLTLFSDIPSQTTVLMHDIDVGNSAPTKQHSYRVNPHKREIMKSEVEYLLQHGFAKPSQSPWSSPCLLVPKSDSTHRFCTDYHKVNSINKPDSFPLHGIEDCVDRDGSARYVTKLDLLKGYWQVP
uniref:Gypsy retrotransposon integrase-like protein 1 n=1 Tax=Cyprinus carpio TaxID=7962 RepID=A0A8C2BUT8_CYPCA